MVVTEPVPVLVILMGDVGDDEVRPTHHVSLSLTHTLSLSHTLSHSLTLSHTLSLPG